MLNICDVCNHEIRTILLGQRMINMRICSDGVMKCITFYIIIYKKIMEKICSINSQRFFVNLSLYLINKLKFFKLFKA